MRLVDDQGEPLPREGAHLVRDDGKLLERRDDDRLAGLERLFELAAGGVDILHHTEGLLELLDDPLELPVEHAPIGYDDDRVEYAAVIAAVQDRELVREPCDRVRLAAPRRVLDQVILPGSIGSSVGDEPPDAVELMVAREDQRLLARLAAFFVFLIDFVNELLDQVEYTIARPDAVPQVARGVTGLGGRNGRVPRAPEATQVERIKSRLAAVESGCKEDEIRVRGKVREATSEGQQRLSRIAVEHVLFHGVLDVLPRQRILQLGREDWDPVEEQTEVDREIGILGRVVELARDRKHIRQEEALDLGIEPARRVEKGELEGTAGISHAVPQHVERAAQLDFSCHPLQE